MKSNQLKLATGLLLLSTSGAYAVGFYTSPPIVTMERKTGSNLIERIAIYNDGSVKREVPGTSGGMTKTSIAQLDSHIISQMDTLATNLDDSFETQDPTPGEPSCNNMNSVTYSISKLMGGNPIQIYSEEGCHKRLPVGPEAESLMKIKATLDGLESAVQLLN
jgi:hypothetical protein